MLDVEVPAGVNPASGRTAGPGAAAWSQQKRPLLVAGSFVLAVVLGVALGLAWASDQTTEIQAAPVEQPAAAILSPRLPTVQWDNTRVPNTPHKVTLSPDERQSIRIPLEALAAYQVRLETGAATPTDEDASIVQNSLFYGAIEGVDREHDVFWAVGQTEITGVPETQAPNPHVWKREGSKPWAFVSRGPGACGAVPEPLITVLGNPSVCAG